MYRIICTIAAILLVFVTTSSAQFESCSTNSEITDITLDGCEKGADKCHFERGKNYTINIKFKSLEDSDVATAESLIVTVDSKRRILSENACNSESGLMCPLRKGNNYQYSKVLRIPENIRTGGGIADVELVKFQSRRGVVLMCVGFFLTII